MKFISHQLFNPARFHSLSFIMTAIIASLLLLPSCSKDHEAEVLDLLGYVPAEAEFAGIINLSECVEQSGGKVKDGKITDARNILNCIEDAAPKKKREAEWIFSENSGINFTSAAIFAYKGRFFTILHLNDVNSFRGGYDKFHPGDWDKADGDLLVKEDAIIKDDYVWLGENLNPEEIARFSKLSEVESFRSDDYAKTLSESDDAINFRASIAGMLGIFEPSFSQRASITMGMGMFFNNPTYIAGCANFRDGELKGAISLLDNNGKPSKCELKLSEIDTEAVSALGGKANCILAISVSQKLVKQIVDLASSLGGALPPAFKKVLSPIDGTIAFATDAAKVKFPETPGYRASIATNGKDNAPLATMLQAYGTVKIENRTFNISSGSYGNGFLPLAETAQSFKGAFFGMALAPENKNIDRVSLILLPYSGSLKAEFAIKFAPSTTQP